MALIIRYHACLLLLTFRFSIRDEVNNSKVFADKTNKFYIVFKRKKRNIL